MLNELIADLEYPPVYDAISSLDAFVDMDYLVSIYSKTMPRKYQADKAKRLAFWDMIESFLEHLSGKIPISCPEWCVERWKEDLRQGCISREMPLEPINPFESEAAEDWSFQSAKVLHEFWSGDEIGGFKWLEEKTGRQFPDKESKAKFWREKHEKFTPIVSEMPGGKRFIRALDVVSHDTGNIWVDLDEEAFWSGYISLPSWTTENVLETIEGAKQALKIIDQAVETLRRYDVKPQELERVIIRTWSLMQTKGG